MLQDTIDFAMSWSQSPEKIAVLFYNHEAEFASKWAERVDKLDTTRIYIQSRQYAEAAKLLDLLERSTSLKRWVMKHLNSDLWLNKDFTWGYLLGMTGVVAWVGVKAWGQYRFKHASQV
jgi:hypothetical protein